MMPRASAWPRDAAMPGLVPLRRTAAGATAQSADGAVQREVVLERAFVFDVNLSVRSAPRARA